MCRLSHSLLASIVVQQSERTSEDITRDGTFMPDVGGKYIIAVVNEQIITDDPKYTRCRALNKQVYRSVSWNQPSSCV